MPFTARIQLRNAVVFGAIALLGPWLLLTVARNLGIWGSMFYWAYQAIKYVAFAFALISIVRAGWSLMTQSSGEKSSPSATAPVPSSHTQVFKDFRLAVILGIVAFVAGIIGSKDNIFFLMVSGVAGVFALIKLINAMWSFMSQSAGEDQMIQASSTLQYRHMASNTGIAVDPVKNELHLYEKPHYKIYSFDKVRGWSTNIQTGGHVYGTGGGLVTGAALAAGGISTAMANNKASGLFVDVKDIEHPRYRIAFPVRHREREMTRWMEILRQHINQDA